MVHDLALVVGSFPDTRHVLYFSLSLIGIVRHFGKYAFSFPELDENTDNTLLLLSVHLI